MERNDKKIYRLNDEISFRQCTLFSEEKTSCGDCTNYGSIERNWKKHFYCNQDGIHLHCTTHPAIELDCEWSYDETILSCPRCKNEITVSNRNDIFVKCRKMLNIEKFKGAKLIRLDDWYIPEVKKKEEINSKYWVEADVKTDKDGDREKTQFFIKPEKLQLSSDHKDMDPAKILSKIEVTLKDRTLRQDYEEP